LPCHRQLSSHHNRILCYFLQAALLFPVVNDSLSLKATSDLLCSPTPDQRSYFKKAAATRARAFCFLVDTPQKHTSIPSFGRVRGTPPAFRVVGEEYFFTRASSNSSQIFCGICSSKCDVLLPFFNYLLTVPIDDIFSSYDHQIDMSMELWLQQTV